MEEVYNSFDEVPLDEPPTEPDGDDSRLNHAKPPSLRERIVARLTGQPTFKAGQIDG